MKKETTPSAKAPAMPTTSEKKATPKKAAKADDASASTPVEMTGQQNELPANHVNEMMTNQSTTSDCLIAEQPTVQSISGFPIDVLPAKLQEIVNEANATLGFPKDYTAGSMLTAMAAAIGNTHSAEAMAGWKEYAILFVALVGCPGVCKSHPLSYCMQPLIDHDAVKATQYAEELKRYNAAMELSPKERIANGYEQNLVEPRRVRFMMQDVTNEAPDLRRSHQHRQSQKHFQELPAKPRLPVHLFGGQLFIISQLAACVGFARQGLCARHQH